MTILPHVRERLHNVPLLIEPAKLATILAALDDRLDLANAALPAPTQPYRRPDRSVSIDRATSVAVMPIVGSLVHRGFGGLEAYSGVVSYTSLQAQLAGLIDRPDVRGILLDIDSGGGEVAGLQELADYILTARAEKPIWAIANSRAASAAYWLASAAETVIVAPHGAVGSVGVVVMHQDASRAAEKRGVATTFVHAGRHKVDGNPFAPLPDDVRAAIQRSVDSLYGDFVAAVASNRGIDENTVRATEAAMLDGETAVALGFADAVGSLGAALAHMGSELGPVHALGSIGGAR